MSITIEIEITEIEIAVIEIVADKGLVVVEAKFQVP